jgi:hypothetical protein
VFRFGAIDQKSHLMVGWKKRALHAYKLFVVSLIKAFFLPAEIRFSRLHLRFLSYESEVFAGENDL